MPPQTQRRRRTGDQIEDEDEPRRRQSRRQQDSDEEDDDDEQDEDGDIDMAGASDEADLVKKLVRYALACEYARLPIRRDGIRDKVLGNNPRAFKKVFDAAQLSLKRAFGMEMVELPMKEKRTLKEKQSTLLRHGSCGRFVVLTWSFRTERNTAKGGRARHSIVENIYSRVDSTCRL